MENIRGVENPEDLLNVHRNIKIEVIVEKK